MASDDPTLLSWLLSSKKKTPTKSKPASQISLGIFQNPWLVLGLLALIISIIYFNSLGNNLVSDDKGLVDVGSKQATFGYIFSDPFSFIHSIMFAISYLFFGTNAAVLRLINIIFHLGNSFFIFLIFKRLFNSRLALFSALIFAAHPLLTEAVTWISGGPYSQYTLFFLGSFFFYIFFSEGRSKRFYYLSLGIYLLGLLESNRVLALSPIFLIYEYVWGNLKEKFKFLLPYFGLSVLWGLIYFFQIGNRIVNLPQITYSAGGFYNPFLQVPYAIWTYFKLIFWPQDLSFYESDFVPSLGKILFRDSVVLIYLGTLVYFFRENKKLFFLLAFFLIGLAITLTPLKIAVPVADRYAYFSSIGIIVFVAYFLDIFAQEKKWQALIYIMVGLVIASLGLRTIFRNTDWKDTDTLALATVRTTPSSPRAHNLAGAYYFKIKDFDKAEKEFRSTISLNPNFAEAYHNLAVIYSINKKYPEAINLDLKAISLDNKLVQAYVSLTESYLKNGDKDNGKKVLEILKKAGPDNPTILKLEKEFAD